jgi:hypothetical protein
MIPTRLRSEESVRRHTLCSWLRWRASDQATMPLADGRTRQVRNGTVSQAQLFFPASVPGIATISDSVDSLIHDSAERTQ